MSASFHHLIIPREDDRDKRPYNHRVRIASAARGSRDAQNRFTFYPDNNLRWQGNEPVRAEDGRTEYGFPDEATARKFAVRLGGEYVGTKPPPRA